MSYQYRNVAENDNGNERKPDNEMHSPRSVPSDRRAEVFWKEIGSQIVDQGPLFLSCVALDFRSKQLLGVSSLEKNRFTEVVRFELRSARWSACTRTRHFRPPKRVGAAGVVSRGHLYLFGGYELSNHFDDSKRLSIGPIPLENEITPSGISKDIFFKSQQKAPRTSLFSYPIWWLAAAATRRSLNLNNAALGQSKLDINDDNRMNIGKLSCLPRFLGEALEDFHLYDSLRGNWTVLINRDGSSGGGGTTKNMSANSPGRTALDSAHQNPWGNLVNNLSHASLPLWRCDSERFVDHSYENHSPFQNENIKRLASVTPSLLRSSRGADLATGEDGRGAFETPPSRAYHTLVKCGVLLYLFGGERAERQADGSYQIVALDDLWACDLRNLRWYRLLPTDEVTSTVPFDGSKDTIPATTTASSFDCLEDTELLANTLTAGRKEHYALKTTTTVSSLPPNARKQPTFLNPHMKQESREAALYGVQQSLPLSNNAIDSSFYQNNDEMATTRDRVAQIANDNKGARGCDLVSKLAEGIVGRPTTSSTIASTSDEVQHQHGPIVKLNKSDSLETEDTLRRAPTSLVECIMEVEQVLLEPNYTPDSSSVIRYQRGASVDKELSTIHRTGDVMSPKARSGHSCIVHRKTIYVYGGINAQTGEVYDDLWAFDIKGTTWRHLITTGDKPGPRFGHGAVLTPAGLCIVGGLSPADAAAVRDVRQHRNIWERPSDLVFEDKNAVFLLNFSSMHWSKLTTATPSSVSSDVLTSPPPPISDSRFFGPTLAFFLDDGLWVGGSTGRETFEGFQLVKTSKLFESDGNMTRSLTTTLSSTSTAANRRVDFRQTTNNYDYGVPPEYDNEQTRSVRATESTQSSRMYTDHRHSHNDGPLPFHNEFESTGDQMNMYFQQKSPREYGKTTACETFEGVSYHQDDFSVGRWLPGNNQRQQYDLKSPRSAPVVSFPNLKIETPRSQQQQKQMQQRSQQAQQQQQQQFFQLQQWKRGRTCPNGLASAVQNKVSANRRPLLLQAPLLSQPITHRMREICKSNVYKGGTYTDNTFPRHREDARTTSYVAPPPPPPTFPRLRSVQQHADVDHHSLNCKATLEGNLTPPANNKGYPKSLKGRYVDQMTINEMECCRRGVWNVPQQQPQQKQRNEQRDQRPNYGLSVAQIQPQECGLGLTKKEWVLSNGEQDCHELESREGHELQDFVTDPLFRSATGSAMRRCREAGSAMKTEQHLLSFPDCGGNPTEGWMTSSPSVQQLCCEEADIANEVHLLNQVYASWCSLQRRLLSQHSILFNEDGVGGPGRQERVVASRDVATASPFRNHSSSIACKSLAGEPLKEAIIDDSNSGLRDAQLSQISAFRPSSTGSHESNVFVPCPEWTALDNIAPARLVEDSLSSIERIDFNGSSENVTTGLILESGSSNCTSASGILAANGFPTALNNVDGNRQQLNLAGDFHYVLSPGHESKQHGVSSETLASLTNSSVGQVATAENLGGGAMVGDSEGGCWIRKSDGSNVSNFLCCRSGSRKAVVSTSRPCGPTESNNSFTPKQAATFLALLQEYSGLAKSPTSIHRQRQFKGTESKSIPSTRDASPLLQSGGIAAERRASILCPSSDIDVMGPSGNITTVAEPEASFDPSFPFHTSASCACLHANDAESKNHKKCDGSILTRTTTAAAMGENSSQHWLISQISTETGYPSTVLGADSNMPSNTCCRRLSTPESSLINGNEKAAFQCPGQYAVENAACYNVQLDTAPNDVCMSFQEAQDTLSPQCRTTAVGWMSIPRSGSASFATELRNGTPEQSGTHCSNSTLQTIFGVAGSKSKSENPFGASPITADGIEIEGLQTPDKYDGAPPMKLLSMKTAPAISASSAVDATPNSVDTGLLHKALSLILPCVEENGCVGADAISSAAAAAAAAAAFAAAARGPLQTGSNGVEGRSNTDALA